MPQSENWPFKRIMVDHLFYGTTRVWWELAEDFRTTQSTVFQLQAGYTGNSNALDWVNIGSSAINTFFLDDNTDRELSGKRLLTHYRVILTVPAPHRVYVSNPQSIWGWLDSKDWNLAREIVRKERLRQKQVSVEGYLLKRMRYGVRDETGTDFLTDVVNNSHNLSSWGTPFKVGYHPPVPLAVDADPLTVNELRGGDNVAKYSSSDDIISAKVIAFPQLEKEDVWVNATTDQRWRIHQIATTAAWRGVPLQNTVELRLIPHDDIVYKIPVSPLSYDITDTSAAQPTTGAGCVTITHDYPTQSSLVYQTADCCGISGATVLAFTAADYAGGARTAEHAVATSQTTANGTWAWAMRLDPGDYVLVFEKPGEYGPDVAEITVIAPDTADTSSSVVSSSSDSDFGPF